MKSNMELPMLGAPAARTLSHHIADRLRQAILAEQLRPGQRVVEQEIAEAMETSRGPVRDALKLLENEGLLNSNPHRGTFVIRLTSTDVEEIFTLRQALETLAVEYAVKRATPEQFDKLDHIVELMASTIRREFTQMEVADIDIEFHRLLCEMSGHHRVLAAWEALSSQIRMIVWPHRNIEPVGFEETVVEHHARLAAAMRERDEERARAALHEHLTYSFQPVAASFSHV